MTNEEFLTEMDWFTEYYSSKMNGKKREVWFEIFGKRKIDEFNQALKKHIEIDLFDSFPAPGKIMLHLHKNQEWHFS